MHFSHSRALKVLASAAGTVATAWFGLAVPLAAQDPTPPPTRTPVEKSDFDSPEVEKFKKLLATGGIDRRPKMSPDKFLPPGNRRSSEPGSVRVYKKGEDGKPLKDQPAGYPKTVHPNAFEPADDEILRVHEGFDLSSRDAKGVKRPLDFKAGVFGKVVEVGSSNGIGRISVEVDERKNRVEYLHTSKSYLKVGDEVTPETLLGMTGNKGTGEIHLHVQARNKDLQAINPDEVVQYAGTAPAQRKRAEFFVPMKWRDGLEPFTADYPIPASSSTPKP